MVNLIGHGELVAREILSQMFHVPIFEGNMKCAEEPGIYCNIPIPYFIKKDYDFPLSVEQKKSSIDIVLHKKNHEIILIRVQGEGHGKGQKGLGKSVFDNAQLEILLDNGFNVCNFYKRDMPNLFKDRINEKSKLEVSTALKKIITPPHLHFH